VIVCHCRAVNDRAIRDAVDAGAEDLLAIAAACGAGLGCGGCHPLLVDLLIEGRRTRTTAA
jgi:bacterioferritin-associated ferredoxin